MRLYQLAYPRPGGSAAPRPRPPQIPGVRKTACGACALPEIAKGVSYGFTDSMDGICDLCGKPITGTPEVQP